MTAFIAIAVLGQYAAQPGYQVQYARQTYPQVYADALTWVAVEQIQSPQQYYGGLVAQEQRAAERQAQAQQAVATTDQKIDQLARIVEQLQKQLEGQSNEPPKQLLPDRPSRREPVSSGPAFSPASSEAAPPPPTISQAASFRKTDAVRAGTHPGLASLSRSCAGCHTGTAAKGGGVVLFAKDGSFTATDRDDLERIEAAISSGRMPKRAKQPLSLREYIVIRDFLNEQAGGLAQASNPRKKRQ